MLYNYIWVLQKFSFIFLYDKKVLNVGVPQMTNRGWFHKGAMSHWFPAFKIKSKSKMYNLV